MALTIEQEQALLALLNEKKITLSELPAATGISEDDLMLIRQGILDKSVNSSVMKRNFTPAPASLTESGITKLSNAINSDDESIAATPKAVKLAYDLAKSNVPPTRKINGKALLNDITLTPSDLGIIDTIYPVGVVMFFAENKNPNTLFPSTTWKYVGEERTIRLGKMDGSDLNELGGADAVTLTTANLPAHIHTFSTTSSSFNYGAKNSSYAGDHTHTRGTMDITGSLSIAGAKPEAESPAYVSGAFTKTTRTGKVNTASGSFDHTIPQINLNAAYGWTGNTSSSGSHAHTIDIGSHVHSVSGTTDAVGSGTSIGVINAYVKLMAWHRTA